MNELVSHYQNTTFIQNFCQKLTQQPDLFRWHGCSGSQFSIALAAVTEISKQPTLVICNNKEEAIYLLNDLAYLQPSLKWLYYPATFQKPYQVDKIDNANIIRRGETINEIYTTGHSNLCIVTYVSALCEKVLNKKTLQKSIFRIQVGENSGISFIVELLESYHFEEAPFVSEPGQFAVRGGIVDIFSYANEFPVRLEFQGDTVSEIRYFNAETQLSIHSTNEFSLLINFQEISNREEYIPFLNHLPNNTIIFANNFEYINHELDKYLEVAQVYYEQQQEKTNGASLLSEPNKVYASSAVIQDIFNQRVCIEYGSLTSLSPNTETLIFTGNAQPPLNKDMTALAKEIENLAEKDFKTYLLVENEKQFNRLQEILTGIAPKINYHLRIGELYAGFIDSALKIACFTDHQIFERYQRPKTKYARQQSNKISIKELIELKPGDYVVHEGYGIGRFGGLEKIKKGEIEQETIKLFFRDNDILYLSISRLHEVSKYSSSEGAAPQLSKLGSGEWSRTKSRVKSRVKELAFDLISLYAKRKAQPGFAFSADTYMQKELEASFLYEDTPDQFTANEDVKKDMENSAPMDRLICADVGFGKTEIAIRAAFKAAIDGKQTAILVPTTVLALQHFKTFSERLQKFPITIDYVSRLKSAKEIKETLKKLADGKIDILIGTHRILSKDIVFKDLGLLVVDEEQKFGVNAKEKLKNLRSNVDTLTLTATPIPRTLQFSLMGVRDMSVINTPPPNRQPIDTQLFTYNEEVLRNAIDVELRRKGQVFVVKNRIQDLESIAAKILELAPESRIAIAHGQMSGEKVEEIMLNFINREYDILVSTTIIESGLDIPNVNTIIIYDANLYGLSDLHQMRGRVGRSNKKAHCYLFSPPLSTLSTDARKRLAAIEEFSEIGSGIHIAMRDLDIRGYGDILGAEQSGFVSEIGYKLYNKILEEAILEIKEEIFKDLINNKEEAIVKANINAKDCIVETDLEMYIPDEYIKSISERLHFYNRLSKSQGDTDIQQISRDMIDRFGVIPRPVLSLFDIVRIRELSRKLSIERITLKSGIAKLVFPHQNKTQFYNSQQFTNLLAELDKLPNLQLKEDDGHLVIRIGNIASLKDLTLLVKKFLNISYSEVVNA